jgi:hypothetical protein
VRRTALAAGALAATALFACAQGSLVTSTTGGGGHPERDAGSDAASDAGGGGGSAPVGDAIPTGAVSYFDGSACPSGWGPHDPGAGRVAVPTLGSALGGAVSGTPLQSGEDRTHTHTLDASFDLPSFSYAGIAGEANHGVAGAGKVALSGSVDPASTGLPYVQLLACKKLAPPVPGASPLPSGLLMFFETTGCPDGWQQPPSTQGRLLVGLPAGAPADLPFGGAPLVDASAPQHTHVTDPLLVTSPHGIALASGCCAGGYAVDGTYQSTQDSGASDPGLPLLTLLQCQKQ